MTESKKTITFDRKEFLDFLQWVGVVGTIATFDDGHKSFELEGNMGNTFSLEEVSQ